MSELHYTTLGQTVDMVCNDHYGATADVTELVLEANRGVANLGGVLPLGTKIVLPVIEDSIPVQELIQLWSDE